MPKANVGGIAKHIYDLLEPLTEDERARVFASVHALFGTAPPLPADSVPAGGGPAGRHSSGAGAQTPQGFFDGKQPETKTENLLLAARFRELHESAETHSREDLKRVVKAARRNFDDRNFSADIRNAKSRHFFNKDSSHDQYTVSHYGQQFADALPDREAAAKVRKPRGGARKKKARGGNT